MDKERLISLAAKEANTTQENLKKCLDAISNVIIQTLENDENISIQGLGTFTVKTRKKGNKMLPADGKGPVKGVSGERKIFVIEKHRVVKFNITPYFNKEYPDNGPRCTPIKTK